MHKELRWKIPLILFVVGGFFWMAWPLEEKISLGLDLQGGMHLVLEVETEKAVEFFHGAEGGRYQARPGG